MLRGLSFEIKAGQKLGIAGATGGGKSTAVKLLLRMYDPETGKILLDGIPTTDYSAYTLRSYFALVDQDPLIVAYEQHQIPI